MPRSSCRLSTVLSPAPTPTCVASVTRNTTASSVAYAQPKTDVVDIGGARGDAMAPLIEKLYDSVTFVGNDVAEPMLAECRERFDHWIKANVVRLSDGDLREGLPRTRPASVILSVLTLQFVPVEYRFQLVEMIYDRLVDGGAFILVEKVLGSGSLDAVMVERYQRYKEEQGYSREEIDRKRFSLEGVLVPMAAAWTEQMLATSGFRPVDCFWRWMNFAGWIAVKR